jgi:hypothetical protein
LTLSIPCAKLHVCTLKEVKKSVRKPKVSYYGIPRLENILKLLLEQISEPEIINDNFDLPGLLGSVLNTKLSFFSRERELKQLYSELDPRLPKREDDRILLLVRPARCGKSCLVLEYYY